MPGINQEQAVVTPTPTPAEAPAPVETKPKATRKEKLYAKLETLAKRITADTEAYNVLKAEYEMIDALDNVSVGTQVVIKQGRADTAREVIGTVIAVKHEDDGSAKYKVQYGEGFDADIAVVTAAGIIRIATTE
jgi:hypothetical protein